ncbi:hypothetical protein KQI42_14010 [Tissierella sp. MSJ-40]|uniref:SAM-dependent methyltransferase n=1 Tax=Tissierella simiarum TaxID=2841534 RepID=A0ABS6E892_9FIRM|nr:hypothetical protein [Tissierella simiarum]MBU5439132.1 hypothetical protein [Tissierella simiarum]
MNIQNEANKKSWSYRAYEFWIKNTGLPHEVAIDMKKQPEKYLRRHLEFLSEVSGKKIINLLGSNGKKAIPLAILGVEVTIVDISEEKLYLEISK